MNDEKGKIRVLVLSKNPSKIGALGQTLFKALCPQTAAAGAGMAAQLAMANDGHLIDTTIILGAGCSEVFHAGFTNQN